MDDAPRVRSLLPSLAAACMAAFLLLPAAGTGIEAWLEEPGGGNAGFGQSVAIEGDTLAVGAPGFGGSGRVFVYGRSGAGWLLEATIPHPGGGYDDRFGHAVALAGDTLAVGCPLDGEGGYRAGAVHVFIRAEGAWTLQETILASDGAPSDQWGDTLALDGDTLVVGVRRWLPGMNYGTVSILVRSEGAWTEQASLSEPLDGAPNEGGWFGKSVAVRGDTALIGAPKMDTGGPDGNTVHVFTRTGGLWSEEARLTPEDAFSGGYFGASLSFDGDTVLVGAPGDDALAVDGGAAYLFARTGTAWERKAKLTAWDRGPYDGFAEAVALEGDAALVGARTPMNGLGAGYLFSGAGGSWVPAGKVEAAGMEYNDHFGVLAMDGGTAVAGFPRHGNFAGAAYVFPTTLTIRSVPPLYAGLGRPFVATLPTLAGVPPYTWSLAGGTLPGGILLDPHAGTLSGTPTESGSFDALVRVEDGRSVVAADAPVSIRVAPLADLAGGILLESLPGPTLRALELCRGTRLDLQATARGADGESGELRLLDPRGTPVDLGRTFRAGRDALRVRGFRVPATGRYFLEVRPPEGLVGAVELRVKVAPPRAFSGGGSVLGPLEGSFATLPGASATLRVRTYWKEGRFRVTGIKDAGGNGLSLPGEQRKGRRTVLMDLPPPLPGGELSIRFAYESAGSDLVVITGGGVPVPSFGWRARIRQPAGYVLSLPDLSSGPGEP